MNLVDSIIQLFKDAKVRKAFQKQYDEDVKFLKIKLLYKMNADLQRKLYKRFNLESPQSIIKSPEGGGKRSLLSSLVFISLNMPQMSLHLNRFRLLQKLIELQPMIF